METHSAAVSDRKSVEIIQGWGRASRGWALPKIRFTVFGWTSNKLRGILWVGWGGWGEGRERKKKKD